MLCLLGVSALLAPLDRRVQLHPRFNARAAIAVASEAPPAVNEDVTFGIRRVPMVHEHELDSLLPFGLSFGPGDGKERLLLLSVMGYNITTPSYNELLFVYALLPPVLAFAFYPQVAAAVRYIVAEYSGGVGVMVDGNAFAATLLRPTVNGVVVPTLSIALGTLLATTVNVLRDRQVAIGTRIQTETGLLRLLRAALAGAFGTRQHEGRRRVVLSQVHAYCEQIIVESSPGAFRTTSYGVSASSHAYDQRLDVLAAMLHGVDGAAASRQFSIGQAADIVREINQNRAARIAALLATFPPIHWLILSLLSFAIVSTFLIESNQDVLQYLNTLQLRSAFTVLIAVISATSVLCLDLNDPFRGYFRIAGSVEQIRRLRDDLEADLSEQARQSPRWAPLNAFSGEDDLEALTLHTGSFARRRWGLRDTLYFHLMTGRFADQARAVGDVVALIPGRRRLRELRRRKGRDRQRAKAVEEGNAVDVVAHPDE